MKKNNPRFGYMNNEQKQFIIRNKCAIKRIIETNIDKDDNVFVPLEMFHGKKYCVNAVVWKMYEYLFKHKDIFGEVRGGKEPSFDYFYGSIEEYVSGLTDALFYVDENDNICYYDWNETLID